jgi:hypothetical protein
MIEEGRAHGVQPTAEQAEMLARIRAALATPTPRLRSARNARTRTRKRKAAA